MKLLLMLLNCYNCSMMLECAPNTLCVLCMLSHKASNVESRQAGACAE
jgi:hypothetical protein